VPTAAATAAGSRATPRPPRRVIIPAPPWRVVVPASPRRRPPCTVAAPRRWLVIAAAEAAASTAARALPVPAAAVIPVISVAVPPPIVPAVTVAVPPAFVAAATVVIAAAAPAEAIAATARATTGAACPAAALHIKLALVLVANELLHPIGVSRVGAPKVRRQPRLVTGGGVGVAAHRAEALHLVCRPCIQGGRPHNGKVGAKLAVQARTADANKHAQVGGRPAGNCDVQSGGREERENRVRAGADVEHTETKSACQYTIIDSQCTVEGKRQ